MRRTRPDPKRLTEFWIRGVISGVLAVTAGVVAGEEARDAGSLGWPLAAGGFAAGAVLAVALRAAGVRWRSMLGRFPRATVVAAIAAAAPILLWSMFGPGAQAAMLGFGCGFLAVSAALAFIGLARTRASA